MGERSPGPVCGHKVGVHWTSDGTLCRSRSAAPGPSGMDLSEEDIIRQQKARSLKSEDARALLGATLPEVLKLLTSLQIQQIQRVIDAGVINPGLTRRANEVYQQATRYSGSLVIRDPTLVRQAGRISARRIAVSDEDKRIRLDFHALLTSDALDVLSDNPDEFTYFQSLLLTLEARGVWLRLAPKLVRDTEDPSRHVLDERSFHVWLSLGPNGDTMPTKSGLLNREALLGTQLLGANYYRRVDQGPTMVALEREINRLSNNVDVGMEEHHFYIKRRWGAPPLVAEISDGLGGADLPDISIWKPASKLINSAREMSTAGSFAVARSLLLVAALITEMSAKEVETYANKSARGAGRVVTILTVIVVVGTIADIALGWRFLAEQGAKRLLAKQAGKSVTRTAVTEEEYIRSAIVEAERYAGTLSNSTAVRNYGRTKLGSGMKAGQSSGAGQAF